MVIERQYTATPIDVSNRSNEIALWEGLSEDDKLTVVKPVELNVGEEFTRRILIRTFFPFFIIVLFSMLFGHSAKEEAALDRFYVKMKTKVREDRAEDARELELSYANPHRFDDRKMFPNTQWEMLKWNREDTVGFVLASGMVFAILAMLYVFVNLGGSILGG